MVDCLNGPKLLILCTVQAGLDALSAVLQQGVNVVCLVGVAEPAEEQRDSISGWADVRDFALRHGLPFVEVSDYRLQAMPDREKLLSLDFDLVWVVGWQRLVPAWLTGLASLGAIGAHGSPDGISLGRGRSPQNWAIMMGGGTFHVSIFRLTEGVDDGSVITTRTIHLEPWDDIATSYKKVALEVASGVTEILRDPSMLERSTNQSGPFFYYPKRTPSDGMVDWSMAQREIWSHCNALSHPYPGLRAYDAKGDLVKIWKCQPFKVEHANVTKGRIDFVFQDGTFLVTCGDGLVLVTDYESDSPVWTPQVGELLAGRPFSETMSEILQRHESLMNRQPLSPRIHALSARFDHGLDWNVETAEHGAENR